MRRVKVISIGLFLLAAVFSISYSAEAAVIDVFKDGYVEDFEPSGVLDGNPDRVRDTNALLAGKGILTGGEAMDSRVIMSFDLSPYWGGQLDSAKLTGFGRRVDSWPLGGDPITVHFFHYIDDGIVTLDDFNQPATFFSDLSLPNTMDFNDFLFFEIDVTPIVRAGLDNNDQYLEFRVEAEELTGYISAGESLSSLHPDSGRLGPQLHLAVNATSGNVVPEPMTVLLFGGGLIGAYLRKRKR